MSCSPAIPIDCNCLHGPLLVVQYLGYLVSKGYAEPLLPHQYPSQGCFFCYAVLRRNRNLLARIPKATFPYSPSPWDSIVIINPFLPGQLYSFIWLNEEVPESKCVISKDKEGHVFWLSELAVKGNGGGSPNAFSSRPLKSSESTNICASDICPFSQSSIQTNL